MIQPVSEDLTTSPVQQEDFSSDILRQHASRMPSRAWQTFVPTSSAIENEIAAVIELKLSDDLKPWVAAYATVGHRHPFLWNWCRRGVEVTLQTCVEASLREAVCDTRVLGIMIDVLLDDVADLHGDFAFLEHLLQVLDGRAAPRAHWLSDEQCAYAVFTADVWNEVQRRVKGFPRYTEFAPLLEYDYQQLFNVMRYSRLLNDNPEMLNLVEHDLYLPHNMHIMISCTMDLMCSPSFDRNELGFLREAVWRASSMGRIGNLVTTWQREIPENDFTSGVFARALSCGDLTVADLHKGNQIHLESVIREKKHEDFFLERWQFHRQEILLLQPRCKSVDLASLVSGLQRLICLHLGSRGKK